MGHRGLCQWMSWVDVGGEAIGGGDDELMARAGEVGVQTRTNSTGVVLFQLFLLYLSFPSLLSPQLPCLSP